VKCLGVHIDKQLNWKAHISYVTNKVNKIIGTLYKIRRNLTISGMRTIYFSLIQSQLLYCQEIWGTAFISNLQPLVLVQKKIIRLITGAKYRAHTQPLFQRLRIRPLIQEVEFRRSILAFEIIKQPGVIDIEIQHEHQHTYTTRYSRNNLPRTRKRT
jgi:hypothetical protein